MKSFHKAGELEPAPHTDTGSVTHITSCSLRRNTPVNRSFSITLVFPRLENSFESGHLNIPYHKLSGFSSQSFLFGKKSYTCTAVQA